MQIHISPRHLRLTAAIHAHAVEKVAHLEEFGIEIIGAHIVLIHDETADPNKAHTAKIHVAVPGPDLHAECTHEDLYHAMDEAVSAIARQLRKMKTRMKDKHRSKAQRSKEKTKSGA